MFFWVSTLCWQLIPQNLSKNVGKQIKTMWMSRAVLIEWESHIEQDTGWEDVWKRGLPQHAFKSIYTKGHSHPGPKCKPHKYCNTESEKQLEAWKGRHPVSVCVWKKSRISIHKKFHIPQGLCIGCSHDSFLGCSHGCLLVILLSLNSTSS